MITLVTCQTHLAWVESHPAWVESIKLSFAYLLPANEVWGKVIFLHLFVILFTGGWGLPQYMLGYHPPDQAPHQTSPPGPGTLPPPVQSMLGDTVNARAVRILLECNLVHVLNSQNFGK